MTISEKDLEQRFNNIYAEALKQKNPAAYLLNGLSQELTLIALEGDCNA